MGLGRESPRATQKPPDHGVISEPLRGRVAVVTGSSSGIGAAVARSLAQEGASVSLAARRVDALLEVQSTLDQCGREEIRSLVLPTDITDREQTKALISLKPDSQRKSAPPDRPGRGEKSRGLQHSAAPFSVSDTLADQEAGALQTPLVTHKPCTMSVCSSSSEIIITGPCSSRTSGAKTARCQLGGAPLGPGQQ